MARDDSWFDRRAWAERRRRDLERAGVREGAGYLYRPGELLLDREADELFARDLAARDASRDGRTEALDALGLRLWTLPDGVDVPALVRELRARSAAVAEDGRSPRIAVNHVLAGEPIYHGGPGGPPRGSDALARLPGPHGREPVLSVLDTGWAKDLPTWHADLQALLTGDPDDVDLLDGDGEPGLDTQAGHGTFVAGLVQRLAPGLPMDSQKVLDPAGWGDDAGVALGLAQARGQVLNLSLGGYTEDDRPPPGLELALAALGRDRLVVAAAGNNASSRPFWPAAAKGVVGVAAVDTRGGARLAAEFTNRGRWVDACAPGVHLQSAFVGGDQDAGGHDEAFVGWACWSGTSFAAPLVAAAQAREVAGGASPRAAAGALLGSLEPLPGLADLGGFYDPGVDLLCPRRH